MQTETPILETADLPEGEVDESLSATGLSQPDEKIEFHVQMRGYTQRDMEAFIVEAAARVIVGRTGDTKLAKEIEQRCIALTAERADAVLSNVAADILDQPMTPTFGDKAPVTMREFLGLYGREYLAARVDKHNGSPTTDGYRASTRMEYLVSAALDTKFKLEIETASRVAIREIQQEIKTRHEKLLAAEKARVREALAKTLAA